MLIVAIDPGLTGALGFLRDGVFLAVEDMPGQGVSSVFSLGDSYGAARAVLATAGFELVQVHPATWKKYFKLTSDKELSRALATRLFPAAPLHLKKHDGRAEALLLARWLWETAYA